MSLERGCRLEGISHRRGRRHCSASPGHPGTRRLSRPRLSSRADGYVLAIEQQAAEAQNVRFVADSRKARFGVRERARANREDEVIEGEIKGVPDDESKTVRASMELASIARDLGVQWNLMALE